MGLVGKRGGMSMGLGLMGVRGVSMGLLIGCVSAGLVFSKDDNCLKPSLDRDLPTNISPCDGC